MAHIVLVEDNPSAVALIQQYVEQLPSGHCLTVRLQGAMPYSLVLERASGTHNYSVQH